MSDHADAADFRRRAGALCLITTPVLFAAAELSYPEADPDAASQLAAFEAHRGAVVLGGFATLAMTMLMLAGLFAVLETMRRGKGVALAHVGVALMVYGLVTAHGALVGANFVMSETGRPGLDHDAMLALLDKVFHDPIAFPLLLGHYVFTLGMLVFGVGLLRGRWVPRWIGACVVLAPVSDVVLGAVPVEHLADVVSLALLLAGFAGLGLHLLRPVTGAPAADAPVPASGLVGR